MRILQSRKEEWRFRNCLYLKTLRDPIRARNQSHKLAMQNAGKQQQVNRFTIHLGYNEPQSFDCAIAFLKNVRYISIKQHKNMLLVQWHAQKLGKLRDGSFNAQFLLKLLIWHEYRRPTLPRPIGGEANDNICNISSSELVKQLIILLEHRKCPQHELDFTSWNTSCTPIISTWTVDEKHLSETYVMTHDGHDSPCSWLYLISTDFLSLLLKHDWGHFCITPPLE